MGRRGSPLSECLFGLESPRSRGLPPPWSLRRLGVPRPKNHTHARSVVHPTGESGVHRKLRTSTTNQVARQRRYPPYRPTHKAKPTYSSQTSQLMRMPEPTPNQLRFTYDVERSCAATVVPCCSIVMGALHTPAYINPHTGLNRLKLRALIA